MRRDVTVPCRGQELGGWMFVPEDGDASRHPVIIMAHGFSCVKDQGLESVAERLMAAGFVVLAFDYRFFGTSTGEPRGQLFPLQQVEDYGSAIDWLNSRPEVDSDRIGVWGTSFSGGVVLHLAAIDRRVRAVVAQVPSVVNAGNSQFMDPGAEGFLTRLMRLSAVEGDRFGKAGGIAVTAPADELCVLGGPETWAMFGSAEWAVPSWRNRITVESLQKIQAFDSTALIARIAPTPMLLIAAEQDTLIPLDVVRQAYDRAGEPKALRVMTCRHYDVYREPWRRQAADLAAQWFVRYL